MKLIQLFFECLSNYIALKHKLKCDYETLKMNCRIHLKEMERIYASD